MLLIVIGEAVIIPGEVLKYKFDVIFENLYINLTFSIVLFNSSFNVTMNEADCYTTP